MLTLHQAQPQGLTSERSDGAALTLSPELLWLDLFEPTPAEEHAVEGLLGIDVPTREEMSEIESSNRLYEEDGGLYMTTTVLTRLDSDLPQNSQITFILKDGRLITNRYCDPLAFKRYAAYAEKHPASCGSGIAVMAGLLEAMVNRIADGIERVGTDLDSVSVDVFTRPRRGGRDLSQRDYRRVLERIGQSGELIAKTRESLVSLGRLLTFAQQSTTISPSQEMRGRLRTLARDVTAMSDHATYLGSNVSFILDATLGMISIEQNNILKFFSIATVLLLPPSLIGAIYGMNFEHIPWAHESWGFLAALGLMVTSALAPYLIFKRRNWL